MKTMEVKVTTKHANDGIPGESDCCAIALALKESHFPEDHIFVEVNSDGTVTISMKGQYEEDTGFTPKEELYTLYPDEEQEIEIANFIQDYDGTPCVDDYGKIGYFNFPYKFTFFRTADA